MLQLSRSLHDRPVLSLRTGTPVATALEPIINPDNLKIVGFYCQSKFEKDRLILLPQDIRETMKQGIVINDVEVLAKPSDLVRLRRVLEIDFSLKKTSVVTENGKRLGKVDDYAAESESFYIQKLYVAKPLLKNFGFGQLSIDRSQILNITSTKITVKDPAVPAKQSVTSPAVAA